ncbi:MAG: hypothetical protein HQK53_06740, partial [Oligoflexia bacterium]|nr:hypothetical protein [Oligoflexia bacterium]
DTITQLKTLVAQYIKVLSQIDRSGNAKSRNYKVAISFPAMNVSDVLALTKGLPEVQYMSFEALITLLKDKYGLMWAQIVMLLILIMSVLIDLADVVFLSPALAHRGRKELEMIPAKEDELNDWEEKFLKQCYMFLYDEDVAQVHNQLIPSKGIVLVDAFYQLLEEINPLVIDPFDKSMGTHLSDHYKEDFRPLHAYAVTIYNERVKAIEILTKNSEYYLNRYLNIIFPFLKDIILQTDFTFSEIDKRVQGRQLQTLNTLLERVETLSLEADTPSFYHYFRTKQLVKKLIKLDNKIKQQLEEYNDDTTESDSINYNIFKKNNLQKRQMRIQKELAQANLELNELKIRTSNYLSDGGEELSTMTIWWKMTKSFISSYSNFRYKENFSSRILTRRKWLLSMSHRVAKPQNIEQNVVQNAVQNTEKKDSLAKAA